MPILTLALALSVTGSPRADLVTVAVDNVEISRSCRLAIGKSPLIDADGNGVIHITGNDITVEFIPDSPPLGGCNADQLPDSFGGKGIVITGQNVTVTGARVSGYKVGIHAIKADGLTIHNSDVSDNFAQHLKSTPQAEDGADWLWPHANDNNEWITNYGAGLCVEDSNNVTLHDIRARRTQNGIILDAVNDSKVYDCDCSFLSGWGLAMWRSSRNVISRNAFDFCVRGYSHGVYNRGQDSAGILMFEQCCENLFAENSVTHGGDGIFGFAGKEALGEVNPHDDVAWHRRRGCNDNQFIDNDLSFAPAHGLEMTFSFGNRIHGNSFEGNAICGIWGGYSQEMVIDENRITANGDMAYGQERGGINVEHGRGLVIARNQFAGNKCGVHLWWDDDAGLLKTPWAQANGADCSDNLILANSFDGDTLGLQLRQATNTLALDNRFNQVGAELNADARSLATFKSVSSAPLAIPTKPARTPLPGETRPVGGRDALDGRDKIIMTEWGPWDHASPLLQYVSRNDGADQYRVLGVEASRLNREAITISKDADYDIAGDTIRVRPIAANTLTPYEISIAVGDGGRRPIVARGVLAGGTWTVKTFKSLVDPRTDASEWRKGAAADDAHTLLADAIDFAFGGGGMSEARKLPAVLPRDHFGVIATRSLMLPAGAYRVNTTSDDGIRVWLDDRLILDDWTWHAPKKQYADFDVDERREVKLRIEYFELDGHAVLQVDIVPLP